MKEKETKKQEQIYIGIDVSKSTLDLCIKFNQELTSFKINNKVKAICSFFTKLKKQYSDYELIVCMESTGYYNWPCYEAFESMKIALFVVNPLHLKRSLGMIRGKNDPVDALRIAKFISLHHRDLKPFLIPRKQLRILQTLVAQRKRLLETKVKLSVPCNELISLDDKELSNRIKKSTAIAVKAIEKELASIEKEINAQIENDVELKQKYEYITSVQGVGKVLAWSMLIKTNEFKSINDTRKLACYAGVVPFEFRSGTSVFKKPRVSVMSDKTLKKLLHMAAMRAIQLKGDLQDYYRRKVAEGKNKLLVLNAVRNKIVARVCSVIKNERKYEVSLVLS